MNESDNNNNNSNNNNKNTVAIILCWDTLTSSQVSNRDGVVLKIYLDHIFQWPQEGLNCEPLAYEVVT